MDTQNPEKPLITRRKFIRLAGGALTLASLPAVSQIAAAADAPPAKFGGPTPNGSFYVTSYGGTPSVDINQWSLGWSSGRSRSAMRISRGCQRSRKR
jgi:hypothetical protein